MLGKLENYVIDIYSVLFVDHILTCLAQSFPLRNLHVELSANKKSRGKDLTYLLCSGIAYCRRAIVGESFE